MINLTARVCQTARQRETRNEQCRVEKNTLCGQREWDMVLNNALTTEEAKKN